MAPHIKARLATAIALAFNATMIENPQMARLILEKTCRRMVAQEPGSHEAMVQHLQTFEKVESPDTGAGQRLYRSSQKARLMLRHGIDRQFPSPRFQNPR